MSVGRRLLVSVHALVFAVLTVLGGTAPVLAQVASPPALPLTPDPTACTVEPRLVDFFAQFIGTPAVPSSPPTTAPAEPFQLPAGDPANSETIAMVLDTLYQLGACLNAGELLRYAGVFTDDFWRREFVQFGPVVAGDLATLGVTPRALPDQGQVTLLAVVEARVLDDGRVAALVDITDPFGNPPGPTRYAWVFVEQDGRWLIDEQILLGPIAPEHVGTPPS